MWLNFEHARNDILKRYQLRTGIALHQPTADIDVISGLMVHTVLGMRYAADAKRLLQAIDRSGLNKHTSGTVEYYVKHLHVTHSQFEGAGLRAFSMATEFKRLVGPLKIEPEP